MITVVAHYRIQPESIDTVRELLGRHSAATREEPGCRRFDAHQDREDPSRFVLIEAYDDDAAFAAHRETEHFRVNIEQTLAPPLAERQWSTYGDPL